MSPGYVPLFSVRFRHGFYTDGACTDLGAIPTPAAAALMTKFGLLFRAAAAGFDVYASTARLPAMARYIGSDWAWLSFLLVPTNPGFIGLTQLPLTINLQQQNLHLSNLAGPPIPDAAALFDLTGPSLTVPVTAGITAQLTDLSGAAVATPRSVTETSITFALAGLPIGFYGLAFQDAAGAATAPPAAYTGPLNVLWTAGAPSALQPPLALLDLVLAQPPGVGKPSDFPLDTASATVQPVDLSLVLRPRETIWHYYVVTNGKPGALMDDLAISGGPTGFGKSAAVLPNGDTAVLFTADKPLALQQHSRPHFSLSGHRQNTDGGRDIISIDRLPGPPATPVWPLKGGDPLQGSSEIYVYV